MYKCIMCNGSGIQQVNRDLMLRNPEDELEYEKQLYLAQKRANLSGKSCNSCKGTGYTPKE